MTLYATIENYINGVLILVARESCPDLQTFQSLKKAHWAFLMQDLMSSEPPPKFVCLFFFNCPVLYTMAPR
jgi:hypothetical protein